MPEPVHTSYSKSPDQRQVMVWPDSEPMRDVARQLGFFGYTTRLFATIGELLSELSAAPGRYALLDMEAIHGLDDDRRRQLAREATRNAVLGIADSGDLQNRLAAVRLGCRSYLLRPFDIASLLDTMERAFTSHQAEAGKVLVIDDSSAMARLYTEILNQSGFVARAITDPMVALEALQESPPELILMDMYMPGASGEELAKVIRQQDAFLSIPIVYLSAETDVDRQLAAMALGGDDFLQKPIQPEHLVSAVRTRIDRYRNLRALMLRDSLTGLFNHSTFKERLRVEVARTRRHGQPLSFAMLDIDHFKLVNDSYGHPVGDRVIKSLAMLLRRRLRATDVIGRYGGEEFGVALTDAPLPAASRVLEEIRRDFAEIQYSAGEKQFRCTLSAGLAQCTPSAPDAETIIQVADDALYQAKGGGRNKVVLAPDS